MSSLELIRAALGSDEESAEATRPSNRHHFVCEPVETEELEPRQLLSAVVPPTQSDLDVALVVGATVNLQGTGGYAGTAGTGSTVATQATGSVGFLQSQVPIGDLLANLSQATSSVAASTGPITDSSGLLELPITAILPPSITENETPLNNGTDIDGTVWITPPPVPPGIFHPGITTSPQFTNVMMQTVNPQGGPPTFTHFGQGAGGSMNGAAIEEAVAVGPIGPSITDEISAAEQPPPVEAHQPAGPPVQVQQDETTPQQDAHTPPTPGTNTPPANEQGQGQGTGQGQNVGGQGAEGHSGGQTANPGTGAGAEMQGGAPGAAGGGGSGGSSGGGAAYLDRPHIEIRGLDPDSARDLIDEAIPSLVAQDRSPNHDDSQPGLSTLFGAAAVAAGGFQLALRKDDGRRGSLEQGPSDGDDASRGRNAGSSRN